MDWKKVSSPSSSFGRRIEIDTIRILAIIFVVIIHVTAPFINYPPLFQSPTWWMANSINSASEIAVPLFIMVSGSLLLGNDNKYTMSEFFLRRMARIGPPLIFWSFFYFFWRKFFWGQKITNINLIGDLATGNTYYHLYFLYVISGLYLITPLLNKYLIGPLRNIGHYIFFLFLSIVVMSLFNDFVLGFNIFGFFITLFVPYIAYYCAGAYFIKNDLQKIGMLLPSVLYIFFSGLTAILNYINMKSIGWNNTMINVPSLHRYFYGNLSINIIVESIVFYVLIINSFRCIRINQKIESFIEIASANVFGIYLIHPLVIDLIDRYSLLDVSRISHVVWGFMIIKIIGTIAISYLAVSFARRISLLKLILG